jgi:hypothetical protein
MGLLGRKQGFLDVSAAVGSFTRADRERGLDLLQDAEELFVGIRAPSRLGTAVLSVLMVGMGFDEQNPSYGALLGAALLGYACRMGQPSPPRPENELARIERHLPRTLEGGLDHDVFAEEPDRLRGLVDYVIELDDERFQRLLGNSPEAWAVFSSTATMQLHKNLARNGMRRRQLPDPELLQGLLAIGYPVRVIDEVAGESPYSGPS